MGTSSSNLGAWAFALLSATMAVFGVSFFARSDFAPRDTFQVVEGELVPGTVVVGEQLHFRIAGYERELFLEQPKERIPEVAQALQAPLRLRVRVDPWTRNPARASVIELTALHAGSEPEELLGYDAVHRWHVVNARLALVMGLFCLACTIACLMLIASRGAAEDVARLDPPRGAAAVELYVSWPKAFVSFLVCFGMLSLFVWGAFQSVFLGVLSIPMGLLFGLTCWLILPWLIPGRKMLTIDEEGIVDRQIGFGRIPWSRIRAARVRPVNGVAYLCLEVDDEQELVRGRSWLVRLGAWSNRLIDYPVVSICLFPMATTTAEVAAVVRSHGYDLERGTRC